MNYYMVIIVDAEQPRRYIDNVQALHLSSVKLLESTQESLENLHLGCRADIPNVVAIELEKTNQPKSDFVIEGLCWKPHC